DLLRASQRLAVANEPRTRNMGGHRRPKPKLRSGLLYTAIESIRLSKSGRYKGVPPRMGQMAMRPPFRADHVGSLLRPQELRTAFLHHARGTLAAPQFTEILHKAIRDVVRLQEEVGLEVVTDGEFRRISSWGRFVERCRGFAIKPAQFKFRSDGG